MVSGKLALLVRSRAFSTESSVRKQGQVRRGAARLSKHSCHAATAGQMSTDLIDPGNLQSREAFLLERHAEGLTSGSSQGLDGQSCHNECGQHIQSLASPRPG